MPESTIDELVGEGARTGRTWADQGLEIASTWVDFSAKTLGGVARMLRGEAEAIANNGDTDRENAAA